MLSKQPVSAANLTASGVWAWSKCRVTGTEAALQAECAAAARRVWLYSCAQGKRRMMAGDRFASAARTVAMMPSRLYWYQVVDDQLAFLSIGLTQTKNIPHRHPRRHICPRLLYAGSNWLYCHEDREPSLDAVNRQTNNLSLREMSEKSGVRHGAIGVPSCVCLQQAKEKRTVAATSNGGIAFSL